MPPTGQRIDWCFNTKYKQPYHPWDDCISTHIWLIFQKGPFDKFQLGLRFQHFGSFVGLGSKYPTHIEDHHSTLLHLLYNVQTIVLVLGRHNGTMILTPFPITAGASLPQLVAGCLTSIQGMLPQKSWPVGG